jgi:ferredoxin
MARPLWFVQLIKKTFPNVKIIAKLTNIPILGTLFDLLLFKGDDLIYLPQDKIIEVDRELEEYSEYVLPSQILEYFIQKAKYHWIMDFCICRTSMECKDYPRDLGCLFLGDAVLDINPQLGRLVSKEEALEHLKKCREAGLVHMVGRNKLDAQWLGVKPGEKLLSICNCCPCCCLWRISPIVNSKIGSKVNKMPGVTVKVTDRCIGCGTCLKGVCFVDAITLVDNHAIISDMCKGCGRCVSICPQNAIELTIEDEQYVKKAIKRLDKLVDVT